MIDDSNDRHVQRQGAAPRTQPGGRSGRKQDHVANTGAASIHRDKRTLQNIASTILDINDEKLAARKAGFLDRRGHSAGDARDLHGLKIPEIAFELDRGHLGADKLDFAFRLLKHQFMDQIAEDAL